MTERELRLRRRQDLLDEIAEMEKRRNIDGLGELHGGEIPKNRIGKGNGADEMSVDNIKLQREKLIRQRREERDNSSKNVGDNGTKGIGRRWSEPDRSRVGRILEDIMNVEDIDKHWKGTASRQKEAGRLSGGLGENIGLDGLERQRQMRRIENEDRCQGVFGVDGDSRQGYRTGYREPSTSYMEKKIEEDLKWLEMKELEYEREMKNYTRPEVDETKLI